MKFSVIIPVYEHWHLVPKLLTRLLKQTYPSELFEILLVDNGSSHFVPPSVLPANARILECMTPGSYAARNHGIRHARGEWLVFTDADCLPRADWLEQLAEARLRLSDPRIILAGAIEVVSESPQPNAYEIYEMVKGIPQDWYVRRGYAATANLAVTKALALGLDGFDATRYSGGDADFCRRAGKLGGTVVYIPQARVEHPPRTSWQAIVTKARRVKGGQLAAGSRRRRLLWLARTLTPPVRGLVRFVTASDHSLRSRLIAAAILLRIWVAELAEALRLTLNGKPERS